MSAELALTLPLALISFTFGYLALNLNKDKHEPLQLLFFSGSLLFSISTTFMVLKVAYKSSYELGTVPSNISNIAIIIFLIFIAYYFLYLWRTWIKEAIKPYS